MRGLTFKSYFAAGKKGFDPIRVPDELAKMEKATADRIQAMKQVAQDQQKRDNTLIRHVEDNAWKQMSMRQKDFDATTYHMEGYHQAEQQILKTKIKDAERGEQFETIKAQKEQYAREQLKQLIPQTFKAVGGALQAREQYATAIADKFAMEYGATPAQIAYMERLEIQTTATEAGVQHMLNKNRHELPIEMVEAFGRLSGYQKLQLKKGAIAKFGEAMIPHYFKLMADEQFKINDPLANKGAGGEISLSINDIKSSTQHGSQKLDAVYRVAQTKLIKHLRTPKAEGGGGLSTFDPGFLATELRPWIHKYVQAEKIGQAERDWQNHKVREWDTKVETFIGKINEHGQKNIGESWNMWVLGGDPSDRAGRINEGLKILEHMAKRGRYTSNGGLSREMANAIQDQEIPMLYPGDEKHKGMTWRQRHGSEAVRKGIVDPGEHSARDKFAPLNKIFDDQEVAELAAYDRIADETSGNLRSQLYAASRKADGAFNSAHIAEIEKMALASGVFGTAGLNHKALAWLKDVKNSNQMALDNSKETAEDRYKAGTLTAIELFSGNYHPSVVREYKDKIKDGLASLHDKGKGRIRIVQKAVETVGDFKLLDGTGTVNDLRMAEYAAEDFKQTFLELYSKYPSDVVERAIAAEELVVDKIEKGIGAYKRSGGAFNQTWDRFKKKSSTAHRDRLGRQLNNNSNAIFEPDSGIVTPEVINHTKLWARGLREMPPEIAVADQHITNMGPWAIAQKAMEAHGEKDFKLPPGVGKLEGFVDLKYRRLLCNRNSAFKTMNACRKTALEHGATPEETSNLQSMILNNPGFNQTPEQQTGNVVEQDGIIQSGEQATGTDITKMSIGNLYEGLRTGRLNGRLGSPAFTQADIAWGVHNLQGFADSYFDLVNQQALQKVLFDRDTATITTSDNYVIGGHTEHIGPQIPVDEGFHTALAMKFHNFNWHQATPSIQERLVGSMSRWQQEALA